MVKYSIQYLCDYCSPDKQAFIALIKNNVVTHACRPCAEKYRHGDDITEIKGVISYSFEEKETVLEGCADLIKNAAFLQGGHRRLRQAWRAIRNQARRVCF